MHFAAYDKADISAEWSVLEGTYRVDACVSGKIVARLAWGAFVDFGASLPGWFHIDAGVGFQEGELVSARIKAMEKGRRPVELTQVKRANQAPEDTARKLADPQR
jgi:ribosomal protein S1